MKISGKEKEKLRNKLYKRDGRQCHYCGIEEGDFILIWGKFYGGEKRGKGLEVHRKDNEKGYNEGNCVLTCPVCNNAKSDKFTYEEFKKVGDVIKEIWQQRKKATKKEMVKMRKESDAHITVTRGGKKLIDNGELTKERQWGDELRKWSKEIV